MQIGPNFCTFLVLSVLLDYDNDDLSAMSIDNLDLS